MKKFSIFLIAAMALLASCSKQTVLPVPDTPLEQFLAVKKAKGLGNGHQGAAPEVVLSSFTATSPGDNQVDWTAPELQPGNKWTWVEVDVLDLDSTSGSLIKNTGGAMKYMDSYTPEISYTNGNWYRTFSGTHYVRVYLWQATPNPLRGLWNPAGYWEPDYLPDSWQQAESNDLADINFHL